MKFLNSIRIYSISILALSLVLSACQKDGQKGSAGNGAPAIPGKQEPNTDGTGDVGGGNGVNGRVLESYRVDVTQLKGYQQVVESKYKRDEQSEEDKEGVRRAANFKAWYIAPLKFKTLKNKVLGLSFTEDHTEQLAVQTQAEVWIDQEAFEKMTVQQQGELIAHELFMAYYLLKFETSESICRRMFAPSRANLKVDCTKIERIPPFNKKPDPARELNEQDYQNIRAATSWFLNEPGPIDHQLQVRKFQSLGFDERLFNIQSKPSSDSFNSALNTQLKGEQMTRLLQQGMDRQLFSSVCETNIDGLKTEIACGFKMKTDSTTNQNVQVINWELNSEVQVKEKTFFQLNGQSNSVFSITGSDHLIEVITLGRLDDRIPLESVSVGQKYFDMALVVKKTTEHNALKVELMGLLLVNKVYHGQQDLTFPNSAAKVPCYSNSHLLNKEGFAQYLFLKSKKMSEDEFNIEIVLEYGFRDYTCDDVQSSINSNSNSNTNGNSNQ